MTYDVIVIGLGGMGSAAAAHLAARGQRVLGLERFGPAHDHGSSHGGSRIIRQSYFEDPAYVPLLLRAYELWEQLEADSGADLMTLTGGLYLGRPDSPTVAGSLRSARQWDLPHELLDAAEIRRRFPTHDARPTTRSGCTRRRPGSSGRSGPSRRTWRWPGAARCRAAVRGAGAATGRRPPTAACG